MSAISDAMVHRFLKDYWITLPVQKAEFLDYYANAFDEYFDLKKKLYSFLECRLGFSSDEEFYLYRNNIISEMIKHIENHQDYETFNKADICFKSGLLTKGISNKQIFTNQNVDKSFLSIDLKSGNFFALKNWSKNLVKNCETWEEFAGTFTKYEYFANTKHLRQSLLGKLNPKRILNYEKLILERNILSHILMNSNLKLNDIVCANFDEIIFKISDDFDVSEIEIPEQYKNDVHIEKYKLEKIEPYSFYIKRFDDGSFKLKCVDVNLFPQVYKHVVGKSLHNRDLYFVSQSGQLAKYVETLF